MQDDEVPEQERTHPPADAPPDGATGRNGTVHGDAVRAMSATPPAGQRFAELDVFRGIAALTVVLYHYSFRFDQLYGLETLSVTGLWLGRYGVHFFFLISGFVICWSLSNANGLAAFLVSRVSRIYPAYWVAVVATFSIVAIVGLPGREVGVGAFLFNLTMLQDFFYVPRVDRAYWTLTVELTFYFWIALAYLAGQLHRAEYLFLPLMLLGALVHLGLVELPARLALLLLVKHANLFGAGIVFFRLHASGLGPAARRTATWYLPLSAAVNFAVYPPIDALFVSSFYVVFLLAVCGRLGWLCRAPLLWLGGISYSLYLLHQNIGYVIIRTVESWIGSERVGIVVALVVVLIAADLLTRTVERPAARRLRRLAGGFRRPGRAALGDERGGRDSAGA